jgi:hypothetical protein
MMILTRPCVLNDSFLNCLEWEIDLTRHCPESRYDVVFDLPIKLISETSSSLTLQPSSSSSTSRSFRHSKPRPRPSLPSYHPNKGVTLLPFHTPRHIYNKNNNNHVVRPRHHPQLGQPSLCHPKRRQQSRSHVFPRSTHFARVALCLRCESDVEVPVVVVVVAVHLGVIPSGTNII